MEAAALDRIERSFADLEPRMESMTAAFYARLFAAHPEIRALFHVDMQVQRQHFAAAIALITRNLHLLDSMVEPLRQLGADHARVGTRPMHYPPVRDAMLSAIGEALGAKWSAQLESDWRTLLDVICQTMLEGASRSAQQYTS